MNASLFPSDSVEEQQPSLTALVQPLQQELGERRRENAELRRQASELRCEAGYWKRQHARALERNAKLGAERDQARAEVRQLKAERFGKSSEKQSATDRSHRLEDPAQPATPQKKRGQQPNRPAPKRRDYSHLPTREERIDLLEGDKVCGCCGKPLADLGDSEDGERIEIETVVSRRVVRRKRYRRTCDWADPPRIVAPPLPPKLLPQSRSGTRQEPPSSRPRKRPGVSTSP